MSFVRHADAILVLADASELMSPEAARAYDGEIAGILRRIGKVKQGARVRPSVSLVFTKIDAVPAMLSSGPTATEPFDDQKWEPLLRAGAIRTAMQALQRQGVALAAFSVSAFPSTMSKGQPFGVIAPFEYVLRHSEARVPLQRTRLAIDGRAHSFHAYDRAPKEWE